MSHLDEMIGDGVHVYQNKRTVADAYVMVRWSKNIPKTWESYPNISRFMKAIEQDASVQAVLNNQKQ